jgi:uncharacterized membrane protein YeaQ/YmgE (transglycosylase-associated protein family)
MTLLGVLLLILLGAVCGVVAELIVGFSPGGFLASAAVGFVGAWVGAWLAGALHLPSMLVVNIEGHAIEVVWTVLGAILLLLVVSVVRHRPYYSRWG